MIKAVFFAYDRNYRKYPVYFRKAFKKARVKRKCERELRGKIKMWALAADDPDTGNGPYPPPPKP